MADEQTQGSSGPLAWIRDIAVSWGPAIFAVLFVRTFVFEPFRIPSGSMVPTLLVGDHVAVSKFSYGIWVPGTLVDIPFFDGVWLPPRYQLLDFGGPERGDIVVFRFPKNEEMNYIKRIVGLPGDRLRVKNNRIFINDVEQTFTPLDTFDFQNAGCSKRPMKRYIEDLGGLKHEVLVNRGLGGRLSDKAELLIPEDRYFAMGDNRDNSGDSREGWFVRPDQIKGKAHAVWFSWNGCESGIRSDRFFEGLY